MVKGRGLVGKLLCAIGDLNEILYLFCMFVAISLPDEYDLG